MTARAPLALLLALALVPACSRSSTAPAGLTRVKLQLNWVSEPEFGGYYAARETSRFRERGLDVEITGGGPSMPTVQLVAGGQADFGIVSGDELLLARARGIDLVPLLAVFQTTPHGIMVHRSRGARRMADILDGGTLAIEPGSAHALFLQKKLGYGKAHVVPYDGGVARFVADKQFAQQCFVTAEPIAARRAGADPQVLLFADEGWNPYQGVLVTRRALLTEKPAVVRDMVLAAIAGWRAYLDDPAPTNATMLRLNRVADAETFAAIAVAQKPFIETDETRKSGLGAMKRERWEVLGRQMVELGLIDKVPSVPEYTAPR